MDAWTDRLNYSFKEFWHFYSVTISFMDTFTNVPILRQIKVEWRIFTEMIILVCFVTKSKSQSGVLISSFPSLCLQLENISCLRFKVANSGLKTMLYFSLIQSLHISEMGLNVGMFLSNILHVTFGFLFAPISFQKWVERVVEFSEVCSSKLCLCL